MAVYSYREVTCPDCGQFSTEKYTESGCPRCGNPQGISLPHREDIDARFQMEREREDVKRKFKE